MLEEITTGGTDKSGATFKLKILTVEFVGDLHSGLR
jgi:hypothetical protein